MLEVHVYARVRSRISGSSAPDPALPVWTIVSFHYGQLRASAARVPGRRPAGEAGPPAPPNMESMEMKPTVMRQSGKGWSPYSPFTIFIMHFGSLGAIGTGI
jgi:hypothetical protein